MNKIYNKSPLPFQGQKKNFKKLYIELLNSFKNSVSENVKFIDLFGGSGLLSRWTKDIFTENEVIYNDFDNFKLRLDNIQKTNELILKINEVIKDLPVLTKIPENQMNKIKEIISNESGFIDVYTLSTKYVFGLRFIKDVNELLNQKTMFLKTRGTYDLAKDYLNDLTIVKDDFYNLYLKYNNQDNIFIIDPPYQNTNQKTYSGSIDYNKLTEICKNSKFILFSSDKSNIFDYLKDINYNVKNLNVNNYSLKYKDFMIYNF